MPSKGQSQVIQFIMFFMIGLALFLTIGGVFRGRVDFFADDIASQNRMTVNSYFSALAVSEMVDCKGCDNVNITTRLSNTTAGSFMQLFLDPRDGRSLTTISQPGGANYTSGAHGLLASLSNLAGVQTSNKNIILSYSKNQNILRVLP